MSPATPTRPVTAGWLVTIRTPLAAREGEDVYIQNALIFLDEIEGDFDLAAPWNSVRSREVIDEDGNRISEWTTSMGSLREFFGVIQARPPVGEYDHTIDLVIEPVGTQVRVQRRALVTDDVADRLLVAAPPSPGSVLLVVGDRVTGTARRLLTVRGAGYYDLRGHLSLRSENLVIDADVEPIAGRAEREHALSGNAGLEVAVSLLMTPTAGTTVRSLARTVGRSPSTVSEVLAALRREGLVDDQHRVEGTQLFWRVADRWPVRWFYLARLPTPGDAAGITKPLRLGLDEAEATIGWALTDSAAAVAYDAPLAVRAEQLLDFYVPDLGIQRRAAALLGAAPSRAQARCAVRVAPVPAVCSQRVDVETNPFEWPLAHPLFVALDLTKDAGRGREILDAWTPPGRWTRVW